MRAARRGDEARFGRIRLHILGDDLTIAKGWPPVLLCVSLKLGKGSIDWGTKERQSARAIIKGVDTVWVEGCEEAELIVEVLRLGIQQVAAVTANCGSKAVVGHAKWVWKFGDTEEKLRIVDGRLLAHVVLCRRHCGRDEHKERRGRRHGNFRLATFEAPRYQ